jgi:hypothetical protein
MMTGREVRGLIHAMKDELNVRIGIVLKCAVMLMLVFGLIWIGASSEPLASQRSAPVVAKITPAKSGSYSRQVFEERRQRYIEAYPDSQVAREFSALQQKDANSDGGYFAGQSD